MNETKVSVAPKEAWVTPEVECFDAQLLTKAHVGFLPDGDDLS